MTGHPPPPSPSAAAGGAAPEEPARFAPAEPARLAPAELARLRHRQPGTRLLDVRTPGEFDAGHIPGAYNVPLDVLPEHAADVRALDAPVVVVCQSGSRARRAGALLTEARAAHLHVLDGGMQAWVASGLPVRRGRPRLSLERQVRIASGAVAALGAILALAVDPLFALVPALVGSGLVFAGVTDTCGMGLFLARLPYNRSSRSCDIATVIDALSAGCEPPHARAPRGAAGAGE